MKYYIIAGEASGDLHASNLIKELMRRDPDASFRCWGGDLMEKQGGVLVKHYRDLAFMGFLEVLVHLKTIAGNIRFCKEDILKYQPDVLILVDYPGFNLRISGFASEHGIRVFYYISPQLWAWQSSRVRKIRKTVDRMFVILPFEKDFYKKHSYEVDFIGHPLLDVINITAEHPARFEFLERNNLPDKPIIALLPGSRKQEIRLMLEAMLKVIPSFPAHSFVIACAPSIDNEFYTCLTNGYHVSLIRNQTYDLLRQSQAALVTSGTATLETALIKVPQVVCYKGNYFSYLIARMVVYVRFISLVNLIMDKEIVKELIQGNLNCRNLAINLKKILEPDQRSEMLMNYRVLEEKLGGAGASGRAADLMMQYLAKK